MSGREGWCRWLGRQLAKCSDLRGHASAGVAGRGRQTKHGDAEPSRRLAMGHDHVMTMSWIMLLWIWYDSIVSEYEITDRGLHKRWCCACCDTMWFSRFLSPFGDDHPIFGYHVTLGFGSGLLHPADAHLGSVEESYKYGVEPEMLFAMQLPPGWTQWISLRYQTYSFVCLNA